MPRSLLVAPIILAVALGGCASNKSRDEASDPRDFSAANEALGHKESDPNKTGLLQRLLFGSSKENSVKLREAEGRISQLERQLQKQAMSEESSPRTLNRSAARDPALAPWTKVGVVYPQGAPLSGDLNEVLTATALDYPITLAPAGAVAEQLNAAACSADAIGRCLSALARYPGVQVLAVIEPLQPTASGNALSTRIQLYDTAAGHAFPATAVEVPAVDGKAARATLEALADRVYLAVVQRNQLTPWNTHVFEQQGEQWFLSAGADSGLKIGDRLAAHAAGKLIKSPSGSAAGWIPGPRKGVLEVVSFFGDDLAVAKLVGGQAPTPDDVLLLEKK